jgi:N-acetyl-gamma-glutamyl-phosphate reductase
VVKSIAADKRKDPAARKDMMAGVDLVVLCLPDDAARESVALADELGSDAPKIVDAATAHRVAPAGSMASPSWQPGHAEKIANANRVSNPGCYPTGAIALLRPLVDAGLLAQDHPHHRQCRVGLFRRRQEHDRGP